MPKLTPEQQLTARTKRVVFLSDEQRSHLQEPAGGSTTVLSVYSLDFAVSWGIHPCLEYDFALWFSPDRIQVPHDFLVSDGEAEKRASAVEGLEVIPFDDSTQNPTSSELGHRMAQETGSGFLPLTHGVATTIVVRLVLFVATHPHSVVSSWLDTAWQWLPALASGAVVAAATFIVRHRRQPAFHIVLGIAGTLAGFIALEIVRHTDFMNRVIPGFWVK